MVDPIDVTGLWSGSFTRLGQSRRVAARIQQVGQTLVGTMNDDSVDLESTISDVALLDALPPGADEAVVDQIRALIPTGPWQPVFVMFHLPEESDLRGQIQGPQVQLWKRYRGHHFAGYRMGDYRIGTLGEGQEFVLQGSLNSDGSEIHGRWHAVGEELSLFHQARGPFVLRRSRMIGVN